MGAYDKLEKIHIQDILKAGSKLEQENWQRRFRPSVFRWLSLLRMCNKWLASQHADNAATPEKVPEADFRTRLAAFSFLQKWHVDKYVQRYEWKDPNTPESDLSWQDAPNWPLVCRWLAEVEGFTEYEQLVNSGKISELRNRIQDLEAAEAVLLRTSLFTNLHGISLSIVWRHS